MPVALCASLALASVVGAVQDPHPRLAAHAAWRAADAASPFATLRWDAVGPRFCGGRIESIAVPAQHPYTLWVAPGSGNLWKSTDGGLHWRPVFEHEATAAIGDVCVAPSDPDVVWVGTGEAHLGGMSYDGCGVYRTTDGGATWQHVGLADVDRIGKVRVDPADPARAWVAAIGPLGDRGREAACNRHRHRSSMRLAPSPAGDCHCRLFGVPRLRTSRRATPLRRHRSSSRTGVR